MQGQGREYPADFANWPREHRVDWLRTHYKRRSLIFRVLTASGFEPDRVGADYHVTSEELAGILVTLVDNPEKEYATE